MNGEQPWRASIPLGTMVGGRGPVSGAACGECRCRAVQRATFCESHERGIDLLHRPTHPMEGLELETSGPRLGSGHFVAEAATRAGGCQVSVPHQVLGLFSHSLSKASLGRQDVVLRDEPL